MPVDRTTIFAGSAKEAPKEEEKEKEKPKEVKTKQPKEYHEPKEPKIKAEDLALLEKKLTEQFEKEIVKIQKKERECDTIDERLQLLESIKETWDLIKASEISKWSSPVKGSKRALKLVNDLDRFINIELEHARKIKKSCE